MLVLLLVTYRIMLIKMTGTVEENLMIIVMTMMMMMMMMMTMMMTADWLAQFTEEVAG